MRKWVEITFTLRQIWRYYKQLRCSQCQYLPQNNDLAYDNLPTDMFIHFKIWMKYYKNYPQCASNYKRLTSNWALHNPGALMIANVSNNFKRYKYMCEKEHLQRSLTVETFGISLNREFRYLSSQDTKLFIIVPYTHSSLMNYFI